MKSENEQRYPAPWLAIVTDAAADAAVPADKRNAGAAHSAKDLGMQADDIRRTYYGSACKEAADMLTQWLAVHGHAASAMLAGSDLLRVELLTGLAAGYAFAAAQLLNQREEPQSYTEAIRAIRDEAAQMESYTADPKYADQRPEAQGRQKALTRVLAAIDADDDLTFPANLFPQRETENDTKGEARGRGIP